MILAYKIQYPHRSIANLTVPTPSAPSPQRKAKAELRGKAMAVDAFGTGHAATAVEQLLQPLAQLMIGHSLQLGSITEMLKKAMVEAALGQQTSDRDMTDSRIAILTGVHRKDVRRLRETPAPKTALESYAPLMSVGAQVVARWISEPNYLNSHNTARMLARTPRYAAAGDPDFSSLVAEVSRDVGARAVLDELLRLGIVYNASDTHVQLRSDAFVPQDGLSENFHFLAANVSDHLSTAVHNLQPDRKGAAMLEQSAFSQGLSTEDAAELEQTARLLWTRVLQQFLQKATAAEIRSSKKPAAQHRVRFGVYFHCAQMPTEAKTLSKKSEPKLKSYVVNRKA
jgi:Family of unknown function (DUF6502)